MPGGFSALFANLGSVDNKRKKLRTDRTLAAWINTPRRSRCRGGRPRVRKKKKSRPHFPQLFARNPGPLNPITRKRRKNFPVRTLPDVSSGPEPTALSYGRKEGAIDAESKVLCRQRSRNENRLFFPWPKALDLHILNSLNRKLGFPVENGAATPRVLRDPIRHWFLIAGRWRVTFHMISNIAQMHCTCRPFPRSLFPLFSYLFFYTYPRDYQQRISSCEPQMVK